MGETGSVWLFVSRIVVAFAFWSVGKLENIAASYSRFEVAELVERNVSKPLFVTCCAGTRDNTAAEVLREAGIEPQTSASTAASAEEFQRPNLVQCIAQHLRRMCWTAVG